MKIRIYTWCLKIRFLQKFKMLLNYACCSLNQLIKKAPYCVNDFIVENSYCIVLDTKESFLLQWQSYMLMPCPLRHLSVRKGQARADARLMHGNGSCDILLLKWLYKMGHVWHTCI